MPILNNCCFCVSLKRGTVVIGALSILLCLMFIILVFATEAKIQLFVVEVDSFIARICVAVLLLMSIIISALLIVGAVKDNKYMMLPWVALVIVGSVGMLISIIYTAVVRYIKHDVLWGTLVLVLGVLMCVLYVYLWLVAFSYFQLVRAGGGRGFYSKAGSRA